MQFAIGKSTYLQFKKLLAVVLLANASGLFIDILEPDGALYASIAKHIVTQNDWLNLYAYSGDWLDKPHLPFWLAAVSFKIFGITAFAYKLPSFLCFLMGVFYTYQFSKKAFNKELAEIATLIYATSLHVILCNFDVRAEGYLTGFVIAAMYHFYVAHEKNWFKHIVLAALFTALGIMTKGIFVLIIIGSGFVYYWMITKQWKQFIQIKWYLYLLLCFVFIAPELYALYQQFDMHPEKIVFGKTNVSGLKFFFWDSQFGRFFNTGPIQGDGDLFFFVHTTLWAFLPWSVYLFFQGFKKIKNFSKPKNPSSIIVFAAVIISFLLFSVSQFQLPHYVVVIFPLLSIIVAQYLLQITSTKELKMAFHIQNFIFFILILLIATLLVFYQLSYPLLILAITIIITQFNSKILNELSLQSIITKGALFSVLFAGFFNGFFYPSVMQYQAGMNAGKWQQKNLPNAVIPMYRANEFSFDFYGNSTIKIENNLTEVLASKDSALLFSSAIEINKINKDSFKVSPLQWFPYYHITELKLDFINHKTRANTLDSFAIFTCKKKF
jgi:4-amino-4-deoxy-L-arabinose transferase-like glycosyltransferase